MEKKDKYTNELADFVIKTLRKYADERGVIQRSTSDLSSLEQWLIVELYKRES